MNTHNRTAESGGAIFYILMAIVLLAALTFAVSKGGRGSIDNLNEDRANLLASQIIEYGDILNKAVTQMRLRETTIADLSFAANGLPTADYGTPGTDPDNEVFHINGGGIVYKELDSDVTSSPDWIFTATEQIQGIGTSGCGDSSCTELLAVAKGLSDQVCTKINEILGVSNDGALPPADAKLDTSVPFAGAFDYSGDIIGDGDGSGSADTAMANESAACILDDTSGENMFYEVLWRQ